MGITIATGALNDYKRADQVKYLFDWEGPSNRFITTLNNTHTMFSDFLVSNNDFWKRREAKNFIGQIKCGYFRYQSKKDHVQGNFKGHAIELLNIATNGSALWTRCNDNSVNTIFEEDKIHEYDWVSTRFNKKAKILKYLLEIQEEIKCH